MEQEKTLVERQPTRKELRRAEHKAVGAKYLYIRNMDKQILVTIATQEDKSTCFVKYGISIRSPLDKVNIKAKGRGLAFSRLLQAIDSDLTRAVWFEATGDNKKVSQNVLNFFNSGFNKLGIVSEDCFKESLESLFHYYPTRKIRKHKKQ